MVLTKLLRYFIFALLLCCLQNNVSGQSKLIQQELRGLPRIRDSISLINSLNRIGTLYLQKNIDSSFYYAIRAKSIAVRRQHRKGEVNADNIIAKVLYQRGLKSEALELYSKVLSAYRQQSDSARAAQVLMNMAIVYLRVENRVKFKAFYRQALQTGGKLKQDSIMALVYSSYCNVNTELSYDNLNYYLNKSNKIATRYNDEAVLIANMQIRALELLKQNRKQEAMPLIRRSLFLTRNAGLEYLETNVYYLFAEYYADKPDSILRYSHKIYKLNMQSGRTLWSTGVLGMILDQAELLGNKDELIRVYRLMKIALVTENDSQKKFIGDYVKYNTIQNDNERLGIVNKDNRTKIWLLISVCGIGILLVIFIYRLYWASRRHAQKQEALNQQISEQNSNMQKTLTALEQSQEENTRIMKIVAHDLRSPMAATVNIATILLENDNLLPEDQEMLELMKTSSLHSLDMISDLLNMNTTTEGLMKEPVEMHTLLQYCVNLLKFKATEKKQEIQLEAEQIVMTVNREKIWRVISNLIVNAIKFSPEGSVIQVKMKQQEELVQISIQDEGIGIPENLKDKIFTMFTGARRSGTSGEQSFGLGLAISRQIVEAHGGKTWFESNAERGTTFFVDLPVI